MIKLNKKAVSFYREYLQVLKILKRDYGICPTPREYQHLKNIGAIKVGKNCEK